MKKIIILLILIVLSLSIYSSVTGVLSFNNWTGSCKDQEYFIYETVRGDIVEYAQDGIYAFNPKAMVAEGVAWDAVRLFILIPFLILSFVYFLKGSLRATILLIGILANFFYQYLLWVIGWAYNPHFLIYVINYSFSMISLIMIVQSIELNKINEHFTQTFPVKSLSVFLLATGILVCLLWLKEILPSLSSNTLPDQFKGVNTLFVQAIDLGIAVPFSIFVAILLLKRNIYGYLFSSVGIILLISMSLSIITGVILSGILTGKYDLVGLFLFCLLTIIGFFMFFIVFRNIKSCKFVFK
jgi:hypothetical protein